jgi:hypothetical protein
MIITSMLQLRNPIVFFTNDNKMIMLTYDTPALRQTRSRNLTGQKNASHHMGYLYEACDQISDFCHQ